MKALPKFTDVLSKTRIQVWPSIQWERTERFGAGIRVQKRTEIVEVVDGELDGGEIK